MFDYFKTLIEHATGNKTLSSVLRPLDWFVPTIVIISILSFSSKAPIWLCVTFSVLAALSIVLYILAYIFFMFTNPDALRSEKYSLRKLALEKRYGDDKRGLIEITDISAIEPFSQKSDESKEPKNGS